MNKLTGKSRRHFRQLWLCLAMLCVCMGVFGIPQTAHADIDTKDWMKYVSDYMQISQINLPGSHDSGCRYMHNGGDTAQTQDWYFDVQLDKGLRNFDIRLGKNGSDKYEMNICHGDFITYNCYTSPWKLFKSNKKMTLNDVLNMSESFVTAHPSETIVLMIRDEAGGDWCNERIWQIMAELHHDGAGNPKYPHCVAYYHGEIVPMLRDVRGKVVILCKKAKLSDGSFENQRPYTDYATDYDWNGDSDGDHTYPTLKVSTIKKHLQYSAQSMPQVFYGKTLDRFVDTGANLKDIINNNKSVPTIAAPFLVSTNMTRIPHGTLVHGPRYCWKRLYNTSSEDKGTKFEYAGFKNVNLYTPNTRSGWWQFDFPTENHINQIISSNLRRLDDYYMHVDLSELPREWINPNALEATMLVSGTEVAVYKPWVKSSDSKEEYVTSFGKFPAGFTITNILFASNHHLIHGEYSAVLVERLETDQGDGINRVDEYYKFVRSDSPIKAEVVVKWTNRVDKDSRPVKLSDFMKLIGGHMVFTANDNRGTRHIDATNPGTGAEISQYKLYGDESQMFVTLPAFYEGDANNGRMTYTVMELPEHVSPYNITVEKDPHLEKYTIYMTYEVPENISNVEIGVKWFDGNDKYGLRDAAVAYLKNTDGKGYNLFDHYSAFDSTGFIPSMDLPLMGVKIENNGEKFTYTVHDKKPSGGKPVMGHQIRLPEMDGERSKAPDYHYLVSSKIVEYDANTYPKEKHTFSTITGMYLTGTFDITVSWVGDKPEDRPQDGITVYLPGNYNGAVDLGFRRDNKWTAVNQRRQIFDDNNQEIRYKDGDISIMGIRGEDLDDYQISFTVTDSAKEYGKAPHCNIQIVLMKTAYTDIRGQVEWHDGKLSVSHKKPEIDVIQKYMRDPSKGMDDDDNVITQVIPAESLNIVWEGSRYHFSDLERFPSYVENGSPCVYEIAPREVNDYQLNVTGWDAVYTRQITLFGTVDWEDPTHRPMSIQPVVSAIQNGNLISTSQVTADGYAYVIKNLPISDANNQQYQYEIFTKLPGMESDERIIYTYQETKWDTQTGNVQANATISMRMPKVTAMVPVKLTLKNAEAATEPEDFIFMLEGETRDGVYRDYMLLCSENEYTDVFELNLDQFENGRSYSFKVWQNVGSKPCWDYDEHVEELTLTIRYINGVRVPQLDMGGKSVLEFTNTRVDDTEYITTAGNWIDGGMGTMYRPERTAIHLLADGNEVRNAELTAENDYLFTFTDLPIYRATQERTAIEYTLEADAPEGYLVTVRGDAATGFKVTYTRQITVSGSVDWENGKRPANNQPTVQLLRNGKLVGSPVEETDFVYEFAGQPIADEANNPYAYSIVAALEGFDVSISYQPVEQNPVSGNVTVNAVIRKLDTEQKVEVPVKLTLENSDPATESERFFFLMAGENKEGAYQGILVLDSDCAFEGQYVLDGSLFEDNKSYHFTVKQMAGDKVNWNYDEHTADVNVTMRTINGKRVAQVDMGGDRAVRFTNTRLNDTKEITVTAKWINGSRQSCPAKAAIHLYGDGVPVRDVDLTQAGKWTYTFSGLPLYRESLPRTAVEYTIVYDEPEGYTAVLSGDPSTGFVVTYTAMISVSGSVDWADGKRPANNQPTVQLLRNGQTLGQPVEEQDFKYAFANLPIADMQDVPYDYSIVAALEGFDVSITYQPVTRDTYGNVTANAVIHKMSVPVQVEIPVKLIFSGVDASTVTESFCFIVERSDVNDPFRTIVELNKENNYTDSFVLDASGFESGKPYSFTVHQMKGSKHYWIYDERIADITITIVYINGKPVAQVDTGEKGLTFQNVYRATPGSIRIQLDKRIVNLLEGIAVPDLQTFQFELLKPQADGTTTRVSTASVIGEGHAQFAPITLTDVGTYTYLVREYSEDAPGWFFDHTVYSVKVTVSDVDGQLQATADVIPTITNTFETTMLNVGVKVNWVDNNTKKKPIPKHVQINLFADGRSVGQARLAKGSSWMTSFAGMPEYRRANAARAVQMVPVVYTLTANEVKDFAVSITGNAKSGYVVTYTAVRDVPVTGDRMNLPLVAGILLMSMSVLIVLVHKRKTN